MDSLSGVVRNLLVNVFGDFLVLLFGMCWCCVFFFMRFRVFFWFVRLLFFDKCS